MIAPRYRLVVVLGLLQFLLFVVLQSALGIRLIEVKPLFEITGRLKQPSDVAVSPTGQIYVVDGVNNTVRMFDQRGNHLASFGQKGSGEGEFNAPLGLDLGPSGQVYVADAGNHRVQVFTPKGIFKTAIPIPAAARRRPADPSDVVVDDARQRCYIVDNDNHRIMVYNLADSKFGKSFGMPGTGKRAFRYPFLLTLDRDGYLYIVDVINTRVQVLNSDGLFVAFIGGWGVEKGGFFRPKGVAIDTRDRVYVSDSYMGVIQVFETTGEFRGAVGDTGTDTVKKFETPVGLFIDRRDRLYVVEMFADKVSVFQIGGESGKNN